MYNQRNKTTLSKEEVLNLLQTHSDFTSLNEEKVSSFVWNADGSVDVWTERKEA